MNTSGTDEAIKAPAPLWMYEGDDVIHEDNQIVLSAVDDSSILGWRERRKLKKQLNKVENQLKKAGLRPSMNKRDQLLEDLQRVRAQAKYIKYLMSKTEDALECQGLQYEYEQRRRNAKRIIRELTLITNHLRQYADAIRYRQILNRRIQAHYLVIADNETKDRLQKDMAKEAEYIGKQLSSSLAKLGFSHSYTYKDRTKTDYVRFEKAVATPDRIQFKIRASRRGLFGGSYDLLPTGVRLTEILQPKTLDDLTARLQREVVSPHLDEDEKASLINGAWLIVERLGMRDGIPKKVTYRQLMARYDTADHEKFPIPAGLKKGRIINWVELDSHQGIHIMFNGISGSGKSNAMRAMISCLVETQSPADIRFVLIDLKKQGDFREFADTPHALRLGEDAVLKDIDSVYEMLKQLQSEMHMRQVKTGTIANNLTEYNKQVSFSERLPRIVVVFDEYSNTRNLTSKTTTKAIDQLCVEIGQVGRASGIHLFLGIQQPRSDNMPNALRDNMASVFMGSQSNVGASYSVAGNMDAFKLESIRGRMYANVGDGKFKVQMPLITQDDVLNAVKVARDKYGHLPAYELYWTENDSSEDIDPPKLKEDDQRELILTTAFNEFGGHLKAKKIWRRLDGSISQNKTYEIVKGIVDDCPIEWDGTTYEAEKQPSQHYRLIATDDDSYSDSQNGSPYMPPVSVQESQNGNHS